MSNYIWTEKQIEKVSSKCKGETGWLNSSRFRYFHRNATAQDCRNLMKILVDRSDAFDNRVSSTSNKYRISFDWENKEKFLLDCESPQHFVPAKLLFTPIMVNLPPKDVFESEVIAAEIKDLVGRPLTNSDIRLWLQVKSDWGRVWELLYNQKFSGVLVMEKRVRSRTKTFEEKLKKDRDNIIIALTKELTCMYSTLKLGWNEVLDKAPDINPNCDEYFTLTVRLLSIVDFVSRCRHDIRPIAAHANLRRIKTIRAAIPSIEIMSELASNLEPENMDKLFEIRNFDIENFQAFDKSSKSLSINKDMMTPELQEMVMLARGFKLRQLLLASSNPIVKAKAQEWEKATRTYLLVAQRMLRRISEHKI
jgi:hypothetical protein